MARIRGGRPRSIGEGIARRSLTSKAIAAPSEPKATSNSAVGGRNREAEKVLLFPSGHSDLSKLSLEFLGAAPGIEGPFTAGIRLWAADKAHMTRVQLVGHLRREWVPYLVSSGLGRITLEEVDGAVLAGFVAWLNRRAEGTSNARLHPAVRRNAFAAVRTVLHGLQALPRFTEPARRALASFPVNPWPQASRRSKPRERLRLDEVQAVLAAAEREVVDAIQMTAQTERMIADGHSLTPCVVSSRTPFRSINIALAKLSTLELPVDLATVKAEDIHLFHAIPLHGGIGGLTKYLYPTSRHLVPFVVLFALETAFNPDTVLETELKGISESTLLGQPRLTIKGSKGRAAADPVVPIGSATAGVDLSAVLGCLRSWTTRIRDKAPVWATDRVFLYVPEKTSKDVGTFILRDGQRSVSWGNSLKRFCRDNRLPSFTLGQLRPSVLDEFQQRSGDIKATQFLARHKSAGTTWTSYTSDGTKQRLRERLGEVMLLAERWIETGGVIDPRDRVASRDPGAATPGFLCFDPFDSPRPGQRRSKLCQAYGECPSCPLAAVRASDAVAVAWLIALRRRLAEQCPTMPAEVFSAKWSEVVEDLNSLLRMVDDDVLVRAAAYKLNLPDVG